MDPNNQQTPNPVERTPQTAVPVQQPVQSTPQPETPIYPTPPPESAAPNAVPSPTTTGSLPQIPKPQLISPAGESKTEPHLEQVASTNPNSTQNTLHIAEIRDGIVILNDGTYRSVVMARSINFDLMSPEERESVEFSYQGFLNSLYFDIQIFVRSQKIDMRPYLEKLTKLKNEQENMLIALMTEDYIDYVDALSGQTNIMDKKFYVIIPYLPNLALDKPLETGKKVAGGFVGLLNRKKSPVITINETDLEKAKQELKNRVQNVVNGLSQTGVQALPLDTQELIELYYDYYNPDTATRQQLKNFDGFSVPVITKSNQAPGDIQ